MRLRLAPLCVANFIAGLKQKYIERLNHLSEYTILVSSLLHDGLAYRKSRVEPLMYHCLMDCDAKVAQDKKHHQLRTDRNTSTFSNPQIFSPSSASSSPLTSFSSPFFSSAFFSLYSLATTSITLPICVSKPWLVISLFTLLKFCFTNT